MVGFGGNFERASDTFFLNNSFFSFYGSKIANFLNPSKVEQLMLYLILMIYSSNDQRTLLVFSNKPYHLLEALTSVSSRS